MPTLCSEDSANGMHAPSNKTRRWLFYVMKIFIRLLHMWCRVGFLASGSALFSTSSALCASRLTRRAQPNRHPTRRLTWRGDPCPSAPRPTSDMMVSNSSRPGNAIQALGLLAEGVKQTKGCMDRCTAEAGLLVVFDRAPERPWADKIFRRAPSGAGAPVTVWGM